MASADPLQAERVVERRFCHRPSSPVRPDACTSEVDAPVIDDGVDARFGVDGGVAVGECAGDLGGFDDVRPVFEDPPPPVALPGEGDREHLVEVGIGWSAGARRGDVVAEVGRGVGEDGVEFGAAGEQLGPGPHPDGARAAVFGVEGEPGGGGGDGRRGAGPDGLCRVVGDVGSGRDVGVGDVVAEPVNGECSYGVVPDPRRRRPIEWPVTEQLGEPGGLCAGEGGGGPVDGEVGGVFVDVPVAGLDTVAGEMVGPAFELRRQRLAFSCKCRGGISVE